MARTKRSRRSYGAGEWGRNRVRVFPDPKTGLFQVEWRENGRRLTRSLGHRDWARAKRQRTSSRAATLTSRTGHAGGSPPQSTPRDPAGTARSSAAPPNHRFHPDSAQILLRGVRPPPSAPKPGRSGGCPARSLANASFSGVRSCGQVPSATATRVPRTDAPVAAAARPLSSAWATPAPPLANPAIPLHDSPYGCSPPPQQGKSFRQIRRG